MIIHSIVALEDIFATEYKPETQIKRVGNSFIKIDTSGNTQRVKSIFSTNPADYLDKKYQPNAIYKN